MWAYIVRRILWTVPIVLGVVLITFTLFSVLAKDPARAYAGKFATPQALEAVRAKMGLNKPRWVNVGALKQGDLRPRTNRLRPLAPPKPKPDPAPPPPKDAAKP